MKNFIVVASVALCFISCNNKQQEHGHDHSSGTHQHSDAVPTEDTNSNSEQIEFDASQEVTTDSIVPAHDHSSSGHQH
jgi:hypothetical protein